MAVPTSTGLILPLEILLTLLNNAAQAYVERRSDGYCQKAHIIID
jgi:hypothetical protein